MIKPTLDILRIAREQGWRGKQIDIALGKHKMPESINELKQKIKRL